MHNDLTDMFANHTFVGIVDEQKRIAAIQGGVKLLLVDYSMAAAEYFYQLGLTDFGNFGAIRLNPPLLVEDLLTIGASQVRSSEPGHAEVDWDHVVRSVADLLISRREMLSEYFMLEISANGELQTIPLLIRGYMPCLAKLPMFLLRLGPHVDWDDEKGCFHSFLSELASFYAPEALPPVPQAPDLEDDDVAQRRRHLHHVIENVLFPA